MVLQVNSGLRVITLYQRRSSRCDECTFLVGMLIVGNAGLYGKYLYILLAFAKNLRLLKKKKIFLLVDENITTSNEDMSNIVLQLFLW